MHATSLAGFLKLQVKNSHNIPISVSHVRQICYSLDVCPEFARRSRPKWILCRQLPAKPSLGSNLTPCAISCFRTNPRPSLGATNSTLSYCTCPSRCGKCERRQTHLSSQTFLLLAARAASRTPAGISAMGASG